MDYTRELMSRFKSTGAIIIYQLDDKEEYYLESRPIENGKMGAGKPLASDTISDMVQFFHRNQNKQGVISGIVPEYLIGCDYSITKKVLVWYHLPEERHMSFTNQLHITNGTAKQPGIIYISDGSSLSVFAFKGNKRPGEKTALYRAPYHNIFSDHRVCLGSGKVKKPTQLTYQNIILYWETMFWATEFSHLAGSTSPIKGNVNTYWKSAIKSKKAFPQENLVPVGKMTLGRLLKEKLKLA